MRESMSALGSVWRRLNDPSDREIARRLKKYLLISEAVLCCWIILNVPYTEIDWKAYMQEIEGYQQGERDYMKLRGDTGPLVYPAGFVFLFSTLRNITGGSIVVAQWLFGALYLGTQSLLMTIYSNTASLPPWGLILLCFSRRIHSIFVLRLFNDCWAMFAAYWAVHILGTRKYRSAIILFSLAVSIKMNVLLMAPGVLAVMIKVGNLEDTVRGVVAGFLLQILLGTPFLLEYPVSYLSRAFEFSRTFFYKWTVNWHFVPENVFLSKEFAATLLILQIVTLFLFANYRWFEEEGGILPAFSQFLSRSSGSKTEHGQDDDKKTKKPAKKETEKESSNASSSIGSIDILQIVFTSNFIGVVFARSLHYQFYAWYFHTLPFLLLNSRIRPKILTSAILVCIELVWNIYPPRAWTSMLLLAMHGIVLLACWYTPISSQQVQTKKTK